MPSALPLPTIADLLKAFDDAVVGQKEPRANVRRGSGYDIFAGMGALLFSRQAQRDRDLFRAIYFDNADGDDLTNLGASRFPTLPRVLDTYGTGQAILTRASTSAGAGTIFQGTRILVAPLSGSAEPRYCVVAADTAMGPNDVSVTVPVHATQAGVGTAISATPANSVAIRVDDVLWDSTLVVQSVTCSDGTAFEAAKNYRARVRQSRLDTRKGYVKAIITTLAAAGATQIVTFPGNYTGNVNDCGLNLVYVGDANYVGSPALVQACLLALDNVGVFGTNLQVLPLATSVLTVQATVSLWDDPGAFNLASLTYDLQAALVAYFDGRSNAFTYRLDAMAGAMQAANGAVQSVTFLTPTSDLTLTTGTPPTFPAVLTRTTLSTANVLLAFQGPQ